MEVPIQQRRYQDFIGPKPDVGDAPKYEFEFELGRGKFGRVFVVHRTSDQQKFVAKINELPRSLLHKQRIRALTEIAVHNEINFFFCVKYVEHRSFDASESWPETHIIIMEYCEFGTLQNVLGAINDENSIWMVMVQLLLAVFHMHSKKILHRDIKTENILVTEMIVKLGDFGLSKEYDGTSNLEDVASTICGTPDYMAPEVSRKQRYGAKADIWSLGIVLFQLITKKLPFHGGNNELLVQAIENDPIPPTPGISSDLRSLLEMMLAKVPSDRPSAAQLLCMKEFTVCLETLHGTALSLKSDDERQSLLEDLTWATSELGAIDPLNVSGTNFIDAFKEQVRLFSDNGMTPGTLSFLSDLSLRFDANGAFFVIKDIVDIIQLSQQHVEVSPSPAFAVTELKGGTYWFETKSSDCCTQLVSMVRHALWSASQQREQVQ